MQLWHPRAFYGLHIFYTEGCDFKHVMYIVVLPYDVQRTNGVGVKSIREENFGKKSVTNILRVTGEEVCVGSKTVTVGYGSGGGGVSQNEMGLFVKEHNLIPNAKPYSKRKTSLLRSKWPQDGPSQKSWRWEMEKSFMLAIGIFCFFVFFWSFCQSPKVPLTYDIDTMCRIIEQLVFWNWPFLKSKFFKKTIFWKFFSGRSVDLYFFGFGLVISDQVPIESGRNAAKHQTLNPAQNSTPNVKPYSNAKPPKPYSKRLIPNEKLYSNSKPYEAGALYISTRLYFKVCYGPFITNLFIIFHVIISPRFMGTFFISTKSINLARGQCKILLIPKNTKPLGQGGVCFYSAKIFFWGKFHTLMILQIVWFCFDPRHSTCCSRNHFFENSWSLFKKNAVHHLPFFSNRYRFKIELYFTYVNFEKEIHHFVLFKILKNCWHFSTFSQHPLDFGPYVQNTSHLLKCVSTPVFNCVVVGHLHTSYGRGSGLTK